MNQQQAEFILKAMQQLTQVLHECAENSATASVILGRRTVGRHIVVVRIIAEPDAGFAAPLNSHTSGARAYSASSQNSGSVTCGSQAVGRSSTIEPDYSKYTKHHNKSNQINRWHKPFFDL